MGLLFLSRAVRSTVCFSERASCGLSWDYGNTYVTYLEKLVKINSKLLRILQNQPLATPVSELYTSFNLFSIVYVLQILLLIFKGLCHSDLVPSIYSNYFVLNNEIHNYNTRLSQGLHICGPEHLLGKNVFSLKAAHFGIDYHHHWNFPLLLLYFKDLKNYLSTM